MDLMTLEQAIGDASSPDDASNVTIEDIQLAAVDIDSDFEPPSNHPKYPGARKSGRPRLDKKKKLARSG